MIQLIPNSKNLYTAQCDFDVVKILKESDDLMENNEIEKACQMRYDVMVEFSEELDEIDSEIELDMTDKTNLALVDIIVKCGIDHYFIGDFEIAAAIFETTLEVDPEDNYGASTIVGYCYAGLSEWDSLEAVIEGGTLKKIEVDFLEYIALSSQGKSSKLSLELQKELLNQQSDIFHFSEPLKQVFPKAFESIKQ